MANSPLPLTGKRIVITRAPDQSQELARLLVDRGADVLFCPTVEFAAADDRGPLNQALLHLGEFDWIFFTSQNAVTYFIRAALRLGAVLNLTSSEKPFIAAVGPGTARTLQQEGIRVSHVAREFRGAALAAEMKERIAGKKILLPRSDLAGSDAPDCLRAAGADVAEVVCYRTLRPKVSNEVQERMLHGEVDAVTFASPSAFRNFVAELGAEQVKKLTARGVVLAAIGPITSAVIRDEGFAVGCEAREATPASLAQAISDYFVKQASVGVAQP
jgi:uroporphyrinogen III methyltransferase/synthase